MIAHVHRIRVYYEDTDAGGVVYHTRYLAFAERARTETLREAGLPHAVMGSEHGVMFMVRRADVEYLRPARLDDLLTIRTETIGATGATVTLRQSFYRNAEAGQEGTPIVVARIELVCVKIATGGPARIPGRWRAALLGSMGREV